jgi:hypothetical protein
VCGSVQNLTTMIHIEEELGEIELSLRLKTNPRILIAEDHRKEL